MINLDNQKKFLADFGETDKQEQAIICSESFISEIIAFVTERSLYAHNEKIKNGFLTTEHGVRIGIAGTFVVSGCEVVTLKEFSSLNIRIPHDIVGASDRIIDKIISKGSVYNSLIISPPAHGKTTILKDLIIKLDQNFNKTVLIVDERGEFSHISGTRIDALRYVNKGYAFNVGLRVLSPEIIITDELLGKDDWLSVKNAINSGVKVIATCHGADINDLIENQNFMSNIFDRYIILDNRGIPGVIKKVYNREQIEI